MAEPLVGGANDEERGQIPVPIERQWRAPRHGSPVSFGEDAVKTFVEFRSKKFPPYDGEEEQINPGLWGKRLAEYLVEKLGAKGIKSKEIISEDWGWYIPVENEGFRLAVCCGHQGGDDDEFLCFTDPKEPLTRKLFRKIDATPQLTRLTQALAEVLSADPEITDVKWTEPQ
jgi:hypothetical protein